MITIITSASTPAPGDMDGAGVINVPRLPTHVAAPIVAGMSCGLWLLMWKLGAGMLALLG